MPLSDGSNLGPFRIIGALGRGGMASVYRAFEPGLDRTVAVKVLPAEYLHEPTFAERFRREAQVIAKLEHPNIVPIYAYGIDQGMPWMSMRLVGGGSLYSIQRGVRRLSHSRVLQLLSGVASALDYAHAAGVVHRDVKPQNILIDEQEHVYLADFGIAKMVEGAPGLTQTGMITGTPQYMAPEQALGSKVDSRADIYSLGVVAYECLTGRVPFTADTPLAVLMKHVREPIPIPPVSEVPALESRVLLRALAKAPGDRWPSAKAFVDALQRVSPTATIREPATLAAPTVVSRVPPPLPVSRKAGTGRPATPGRAPASGAWILGGLAAAALVLGAGSWVVWSLLSRTAGGQAPELASTRDASGARAPVPTPTPATDEPSSSPSAVASPPFRDTASPSPSPTPVRTPARPLASEARESRPPAASAPRPAAPRSAEPLPAAASAMPIEPPPRSEATPERPRGIVFQLGSPIALGDPRQSLVTLRTVTFKYAPKNSELQAEVFGVCDEGKDHEVEVELALLDQGGTPVAVLKGRGSIEEEDDGKIRAKQHLTQNVVSSIASFRLTFQARPD